MQSLSQHHDHRSSKAFLLVELAPEKPPNPSPELVPLLLFEEPQISAELNRSSEAVLEAGGGEAKAFCVDGGLAGVEYAE